MTRSLRPTPRSSFVRLLCTLVLAASALMLGQPPTAAAATFTVTKTTDSKDGACNSDCSLREAIIAAHQQAGVDTITLRAGTYRVTLSDLDITSSLTIIGAGAATTIIESNGQDRVFEVRPGTTVTIDKVTIRNGNLFTRGGHGAGILNNGALTLANSTVSGNVVLYPYYGAGIYTTGTLTLTNSTVSGNSSEESNGGGIYNYWGTVTITHSSVSGNAAFPGGGGGITNERGTVTITYSSINGNTAYGSAGIDNSRGVMTIAHSSINSNNVYYDGGGIGNSGTLTISDSAINGNETGHSATLGAGIYNYSSGTLTLMNSTVSGNQLAGDGAGGGIVNDGAMSITNSTITGNLARLGAGGISAGTTNRTTLTNTIVAGNSSEGGGAPDCSGALTSQGYNLIGSTTKCTITGDTTGNLLGVNPLLGPLQNNGGSTLTHLPAVGSPAIDAGNPATPGSGGTACLATDQRGQTRPTDGNGDGTARCDIGAVER